MHNTNSKEKILPSCGLHSQRQGKKHTIRLSYKQQTKAILVYIITRFEI